MPRVRSIAPGFFENDSLADLGPVGQVLFAGLWCWADREGRLADRPRRLQANIFPYYDVDVEGLLNALAERGFIRRYKAIPRPVQGNAKVVPKAEGFIQIVNFEKYQHPHPREAASTYPGPDEADPPDGEAEQAADLHLYVLPAEQHLGSGEATPRTVVGATEAMLSKAGSSDYRLSGSTGSSSSEAGRENATAPATVDEQEPLLLLRELRGWPAEKKRGDDLRKLRMWRKVYHDRPTIADISTMGSWLSKNPRRDANYLFVENWLKRPEENRNGTKHRPQSGANPETAGGEVRPDSNVGWSIYDTPIDDSPLPDVPGTRVGQQAAPEPGRNGAHLQGGPLPRVR